MSRRAIAGLVACLLALVVAGVGCGGSDSEKGDTGTQAAGTQASGAKRMRLGVSMIDLSNPFFVSMRDAGTKAAADYGVDATWQSADGSVEKQIGVVENFIAQKMDAILINAVDDKAIQPVLDKAKAANIPVIMMANDVKDPYPYKTLYPDYDNMAMQAKVLATWLGGKGDVALLIGSRGNSVSDAREAGFMDTMKADFPDIDVVAQLATNWDAAKGADVAQTMLNQHPDLQGVSCVTDPPCLAAMTVAKAQGKSDVKWVSYDGDFAMHPALEDGTLLMDVLTGAERVGYWNIALAARILKGSQFPKTVYLPTFFVSAEKTGKEIQAKGLTDYQFITPEQAKVEATNYKEQFGPQADDKSLDQGQKGRVK
jgi:ribose transport system substrate-binding protein